MSEVPTQRPIGMRVIITYKFIKGPISLAIAAALTFASARSMHALQWVIHEFTDFGPFMARIGHWLHRHLNDGITGKAALLAWLDGSSTVIEGILLATGRGWAEWVVVAVLGMLIPFEMWGFIHHPTSTRAMVMIVNALVVAYLAWRRVQAERAHLHAIHERHKREREAELARMAAQAHGSAPHGEAEGTSAQNEELPAAALGDPPDQPA
jgi:hypothetical protein